VYRRFHDKTGLLAAVIGEDERRLQYAVIAGPPPLGPGAPGEDRLDAFLRELVRLTEKNLSVLIATDASAPGGRFRVGAYQAWRVHVIVLLDELRPELSEADAGWLADALLAPLDPELYDHQRCGRGLTVERITENLLALAARVTPSVRKRSKEEVRERIWDLLECEGASRFPGARGRIPNFRGAERAAERPVSFRSGGRRGS
jgi:AcrR family transcriptional regulator